MVEVVGALICKGDTFMICRRPENKGCALLWEFPGGKLEAGETPRQALVRECREELGIEIQAGAFFYDDTYQYPDVEVHLSIYFAQIQYGEPHLYEHADMKYIYADEIDSYAFCPADQSILKWIKAYKKTGILPGRYRHFKGNEYEVCDIARDSETTADTVIYRALYGDRGLWVRPASMWNETVTRDGISRRRFTRIEE